MALDTKKKELVCPDCDRTKEVIDVKFREVVRRTETPAVVLEKCDVLRAVDQSRVLFLANVILNLRSIECFLQDYFQVVLFEA